VEEPAMDATEERIFFFAAGSKHFHARRRTIFIFMLAQVMQKKKTRKILIILSDRLNRSKKPRILELLSKPDGTILKETAIRRLPTKPCYDEVWKNEEGKPSLDRCTSMTRIYRHPLERKK
jgi:hypothetical protein